MAALFAATYPERCVSLVLYGACARWLEADDYPEGRPPALVAAYGQRWIDGWGSGASLSVLAPTLADDDGFRRWWGRFERHSVRPGMVKPIIETINALDIRAVLPAIKVPTLIMHRRGDRLIDVANGRYLAGQHPGRPLPGAAGRGPHLVHRRRRLVTRRDRGVRDRRAWHPRPRSRAGDRDVHRHRPLDRARGEARRPSLARPDLRPRSSCRAADRGLPRTHDPQHRRRRVRVFRRAGAGDPLRAVAGRRRADARRRHPCRAAHRRVRARRRRPGRGHRPHRRADRRPRRGTPGARVRHRARPRGRLEHRRSVPRHRSAEGRAGRVARVKVDGGGRAAAPR